MFKRFSRFAKVIICINAILLVITIIANCYIMSKIVKTNDNIVRVMAERQVIRETAIRVLEKEGIEVFQGRGMSAYFGLFMNSLAAIFLIKYYQTNGVFMGFAAGFFAVFSNYIGGLLLYYLIFSGKDVAEPSGRLSLRNPWEKYVHETAISS